MNRDRITVAESRQPPANDDAPGQAETAVLAAQEPSRNEPEPPAAHGEFWEVHGVPLLDVWGRPRRHPLAAARPGGGDALGETAPLLAG